MQQDIHPAYHVLTVTCSCGNSFKTRSTLDDANLSIEVCAKCYPFYTGKQKIVDSSGRVDRFKQKYGNRSSKVSSEKSSDTAEAA